MRLRKARPYGVPHAGSSGVGDPVPEKSACPRRTTSPARQTARGLQMASGLGIPRHRDGGRPGAPAHGDPPKAAVSQAVDTLTANTSRALTEQCALLHPVYGDGDGRWSTGYFVSTVGIDEAIIRRYVDMQGQEDAGQAQLEWF